MDRPAALPAIPGDALLAIHDAKTITRLVTAVFRAIEAALPHEVIFTALRPLEFELAGFVSKPALKKLFDRYIRTDHKFDIWLKRSPIHPRVTVVRHSDYTPLPVLVRTKFYRRVLRPARAAHGASLVVWRSSTWLATFTVARNLRQGDFGPADLAFLRALRLHVASAIKRLAAHHEHNLAQKSLDAFASQSPQGVLALDWQLNVLYFNNAARAFLRRWSGEPVPRRRGEHWLPADLRQAIVAMMPALQAAKPNRPLAPRHVQLRALHKKRDEQLVAKISFVPAKTLTISKGSFLIVMSDLGPGRSRPIPGFDQLSPRETACIKHVAQGLSNPAIARQLGVSPHTIRNQLSSALRKLRLKNRYEVTAAVLQSGGNG
jgi:DNA-binding CsgD family transcriptional regulator/PAS domain-containing protein